VVAGHDIGPGVGAEPPPNATNAVQFGNPNDPIFGFTNNFALGTLEISDFTTVRVTDAFLGLPGLGTNDGLTAGLYLNNLLMGLDSLLVISSNVQVYFKSSNTWDTSNFKAGRQPDLRQRISTDSISWSSFLNQAFCSSGSVALRPSMPHAVDPER